MPFGLWARMGPRSHKLHGGPDPPMGRVILGKGARIVKYRDFLSWAVQKTAEPIDLPFWLWTQVGWRAERSTSSVVFARWHQCALIGWHIGATWRIRLNRPSAAAMRPYVKLLWPLVLFCVTSIMIVITAVLLECTSRVCWDDWFNCSCMLNYIYICFQWFMMMTRKPSFEVAPRHFSSCDHELCLTCDLDLCTWSR